MATDRVLPLTFDPRANERANEPEIYLYSRWFYQREDPLRVRFPPYELQGMTPVRYLLEVQKELELAAGVHKVRIANDDHPYVFKEIDRPLYEPSDTDILEQELKNLELVRGSHFIVQLVAVVVSPNPYRTSTTAGDDDFLVLRGFLLEFHPHGTLEDALQSPDPVGAQSLQRWALHIAMGLQELHNLKLTHMDLKPSNIVINAEGDAILIDISGRAITQEWLSPEMRDLFSPCSEDLDTRIRNDFWAFRRLLSLMCSRSSDIQEQELLHSLESIVDPRPHISLCEAISKLQSRCIISTHPSQPRHYRTRRSTCHLEKGQYFANVTWTGNQPGPSRTPSAFWSQPDK
ncbi:hypothetical protein PG989_002044 [Apiospora arundinis]